MKIVQLLKDYSNFVQYQLEVQSVCFTLESLYPHIQYLHFNAPHWSILLLPCLYPLASTSLLLLIPDSHLFLPFSYLTPPIYSTTPLHTHSRHYPSTLPFRCLVIYHHLFELTHTLTHFLYSSLVMFLPPFHLTVVLYPYNSPLLQP